MDQADRQMISGVHVLADALRGHWPGYGALAMEGRGSRAGSCDQPDSPVSLRNGVRPVEVRGLAAATPERCLLRNPEG